MNKRSYLALFLSILVVVSVFAGCASKEPETGTLTPITDPTDASAQTPEESPDEDPTVALPEPFQPTLALGRMEGGTYINTYVGYGCTLDSGWTFRSAEELQQLPENIRELLSQSEDILADYQQITDMLAENTANATSVNVVYTQIPATEQLGYAILTEEEIIDYTLRQKDLMIESYAQAGIDVSSMEKVFVTFLGKERPAIKTVASIGGTPYYILQIQDFQLGSYGVNLTLSSFHEDQTEDLLDLFFPVE